MPPVTTPIDALWHCLYLSFNQSWLVRPYLYSKPVEELFRRCPKAPQKRNYTSACLRNERRPQMPQQAYAHHASKKQFFASAPGDPHQLSGGARLHELTTEAAYEELRRAGYAGNYTRVQALVAMIVRERGEKPSPRLYLPLLLANTNTQHGSPAEVNSLLQEMKDEGFAPDLATYHAALKVR